MGIDTAALKEQFPLRQAWESCGLEWPQRGTKVSCPVHDEKTPSCNVYERTDSWYCFGCGAGRDVIDLYQAVHGVGFQEAVEMIMDQLGMRPEELPRAVPRPPDPAKVFNQVLGQANNDVAARSQKLTDADAITELFAPLDEIAVAYRRGELDHNQAMRDVLRWRQQALAELEGV